VSLGNSKRTKKVDQAIIRAYLAHDKRAIGLISSWIGPVVWHEAWKFPDDHDDIAQEVHARLPKALKRFRGESGLETYVKRITKHVCIDLYRGNRYIIFIPNYPHWISAPEQLPDEQEDVRRILGIVITNATQGCRDLWRLIYVDGLRHRQAAKIMGVTASIVKKRAFICRKKAREAFRNHCQEGNQ
jgi:RNA polymerase sigma factor (sigma-70 family)